VPDLLKIRFNRYNPRNGILPCEGFVFVGGLFLASPRQTFELHDALRHIVMMAGKLHKPAAKPPAQHQPLSEPLAAPAAANYPWSPRARAIASVLIALHVAAVFVAPWSYPRPSSDLSRITARGLWPYLHGVGIYNGYRFFAPNPGPSHVVRYEMELKNGDIRRGQFPDVKQHFPRLLYHRHFMISERVNELSNPPTEPPAPPAVVPPRWRQRVQAEYAAMQQAHAQAVAQQTEQQEKLVRPIAMELLRRHDAKRIRLWSVEHTIPTPEQVVAGVPLDDENLYQLRPWRLLGEYSREGRVISSPESSRSRETSGDARQNFNAQTLTSSATRFEQKPTP
jgi:hypothetical protein